VTSCRLGARASAAWRRLPLPALPAGELNGVLKTRLKPACRSSDKSSLCNRCTKKPCQDKTSPVTVFALLHKSFYPTPGNPFPRPPAPEDKDKNLEMPPVARPKGVAGAKRANAATTTKNPPWRLSPARRASSRQLMNTNKKSG